MVTQRNTKRILIFLAFGIPWIALLVIYLIVKTDDLIKVGTIAGLFFGITPALANVAARLITREGWGRLWLRPDFRRGWRFYLAAWLLPLLAINLWVGMLVTTQKNMIFGLVLGAIYFGEEFGWRAYLLPKLIERFTGADPGSTPAEDPAQVALYAAGARKAALLVGVIWGVWHWPGQFLSMKIDPTMPRLYPLVFLVSTCALSVLLCWVTLRSGSVWPASIGHGTINQISVLAKSWMKGSAIPLLGPATSGLIGGLGYIALALILLLSRRAFTAEEQRAGYEMARGAAITNHG